MPIEFVNLTDAVECVEDTLAGLRTINNAPDTRSREISLAITNIEQGLMWLKSADKQQEAVGNE